MAVVNPGDPVNTLKDALTAYTSLQETMIAEAAKLKDSSPVEGSSQAGTTGEGATGAVPSQY